VISWPGLRRTSSRPHTTYSRSTKRSTVGSPECGISHSGKLSSSIVGLSLRRAALPRFGTSQASSPQSPSQRGSFLLRKAHEIAIHSKPDTGDVDAVLILAATGLEAFLNEMERLADVAGVDAEGRLKSLGQILREAEEGKAQLRLKYELAYLRSRGARN